jgi:hypothetical protein
MVSSFTKPLIALGLIATFSGMAVTDADARHRGRHHGGGGYNNNVGPAIALGLFGALAAGAIIHNQSQQRPSYYYQEQPQYGYAPQGYYQQQPRYVAPRPRTGQTYYETRYDEYGNPYSVRRVCNERYPNNPSGSCH